MRLSVAELASRVGGVVRGNPDAVVSGVEIDSRQVSEGQLFVALAGANVDGHDFLAHASRRGAAAALVTRPVEVPLPQIVVGDTTSALQRLAGTVRKAAGYRLVGVTGSVAKTTTKDFLAALMAATFRVGVTRGSRNSQVGLPAELCSQPEDIEWLVAELGMSRVGELDRLGALTRPDALLYTVIAPVHTEFFSSLDAIAEAKAELVPHLSPDGLLVLNAGDPRVAALADLFDGRSVLYGNPGGSELWIESYEPLGLLGARVRLGGPAGEMEVEWRIVGRHQADNLLAAVCTALHLGVAPSDAAHAAATLQPAPHRGRVCRLDGGAALIDDSYNASPLAVGRLLALLAETEGRRVAVLGEMLELGELARSAHEEAGRQAARSCDLLIAVGSEPSRWLADSATAAGMASGAVHHSGDADEATAELRRLLRPGDVVLVKGSRRLELDRLVDALTGEEAA